MDRNTIIGLVLIFLVLIGFQYLSRPSEEQLREIEIRRDSIARVEQERMRLAAEAEREAFEAVQNDSTGGERVHRVFYQDSITDGHITMENNLIRLHINKKGGRIDYVELKEYVTHDSLPLVLWQPNNSVLGLRFYANNMDINTEDYIFTPSTQQSVLVADGQEQTLSMRLYAGDNKYLEYSYSLKPDNYMVDFDIRTHNLNDVIAANTPFLTMFWGNNMPQLEKSKDFENRYTGIYYNFLNDGVEELSNNADSKKETLTTKVKWVAYKQQFFSSVLIAGESFSDVVLSSEKLPQDGYLKNTFAEIPLAYAGRADENYNMHFYFGPNSFPILKQYGSEIELPKLVNLGWKWVAWINRYMVIPIFNFLENHITSNYGLIIFLLTLIIKCLLFPLTYKSYLSQAKMRVLKPQVDEINKKYPKEKALERQKATMSLYKKAGVNPMGGCLPMLVQFPFLIALFWFFPGAIELRQKSFLWATDLASYDSILDLPFSIPFYGDHVSLFCLLMTAANIIYSVMNSRNQPQNDQMKGMQTMMYIMPIMFLFIFNNYSSGLSYYYLVSLLITIGQTWLIRKFMHDEKLLKQIEIAKTKPVKKSSFQKRLEDMQKAQEQKVRQQQKKNKK